LTDCFLPTNRGATIPGKTTISLKGNTGIDFVFIIIRNDYFYANFKTY